MEWIRTIDQLPQDEQKVIAFVPENYVPLPGEPGEVELKPIKILTFIKNFYGNDKPKHKNSDSNDFWSGEGLSNHFFQEVTHWMPFPEKP
jgi:hypothetical protein